MNAVAQVNMPDAKGRFGPYGGRFVPETLMHPLQELEVEYFRAQGDPEFQKELQYYLLQTGSSTLLKHMNISALTSNVTNAITATIQARLVSNASGAFVGLLQVRPYGDSDWGTVCSDNFGADEANTMCRMLGYPAGAARWSDSIRSSSI